MSNWECVILRWLIKRPRDVCRVLDTSTYHCMFAWSLIILEQILWAALVKITWPVGMSANYKEVHWSLIISCVLAVRATPQTAGFLIGGLWTRNTSLKVIKSFCIHFICVHDIKWNFLKRNYCVWFPAWNMGVSHALEVIWVLGFCVSMPLRVKQLT